MNSATLVAYRLKNFRCFKDSEWIELKKLTILVGKNSSGKSSILRVLPLLKQSFDRRNMAPIVWFGRYVDFGSYEDVVFRKNKSSEISFAFRILVGPQDEYLGKEQSVRGWSAARSSLPIVKVLLPEQLLEVEVSLSRGASLGATRIKNVAVSWEQEKLELEIGAEEKATDIRLNGIADPDARLRFAFRPRAGLIPKVIDERKLTSYEERHRFRLQESLFRDAASRTTSQEDLRIILDAGDLVEHLPMFEDAGSPIEKCRIISSLGLGGSERQWLRLRELVKEATGVALKRDLSANSRQFQNFRRSLLYNWLPDLFDYIHDALADVATGTRYIAPSRATAQRFYRWQELPPSEVDPEGLDIAIFLHNLPNNAKTDFQKWCVENFGVNIQARQLGSHISLVSTATLGSEINLADMGFGFSQLLPVLIHLWTLDFASRQQAWAIKLGKDPGPVKSETMEEHQILLLVEQPELHLHPYLQAQLADVFASMVAKSKEKQLRISSVVETHSEHFINRCGALVEEGKFKVEDISIVICESNDHEDQPRLSTGTFDKKGVLQNWPFGFFVP